MTTIVYILVAIFIFGVLIAVHELGHFLAAKACGVTVNEFSIGMGPALWKKQKGETLAFVGDGINDAPVLSRADIGIAMGALGSDAAIEAADVVLMDDKPSKIALAMKISRKTLRIVKENIVFALAVKFVCLVLGAIGIANMWIAIFADVGVMVIAVLNATRALKIKSDSSKQIS